MGDDVAGVLAGTRPWAVEQGDVLAWLAGLPADSVDLLFCSPPYEKARLYLEGGEDLKVARGTEEWVAWMVEVCRAARRVCRGLCAFVVEGQTGDYRYSCSPFLLAADLHRAGFHLRKPPVYRRNGICGGGGPDWLRNDWEPVICFARGGRLPWSDNTACGHPPKFAPGGAMSHRVKDGSRRNQWGMQGGSGMRRANGKRRNHGTTTGARGHKGGDLATGTYDPPAVANPGNVIDCGAAGGGNIGSKLAHGNEAPFAERLAEFFVRSFCPPGGVCCDPFSGSGTTVAVALAWGRRGIGCDLRPSQVALSRRRIGAVTPPLPGFLDTLPPGPADAPAPPGECAGGGDAVPGLP